MPLLPLARTVGVASAAEDGWRSSSHALRPRASVVQGVDSASKTLIIIGITCGTLAAVILIGILVYLVRRHRRRQPRPSRLRNGYAHARTSSGETSHSAQRHSHTAPDRVSSGYRYDPDAASGLPTNQKPKKGKTMRERLRLDTSSSSLAPPRQPTLLMQSATSPPPFAQYFPPGRTPHLGQPIRSRAELRVGDTPVDRGVPRGGAMGVGGLGTFVPPPPPSWASFWPTESGWTGPGGVPSIRDEDFGTDEGSMSGDDESVSGGEDKGKRGGQYVLAGQTSDRTFGPFKLSPTMFGRPQTQAEDKSMLDPPTMSIPSPISSLPTVTSPRLDTGEDSSDNEDTRLMDDAETPATGNYTLAFGPGLMTRTSTPVSGPVAHPSADRAAASATHSRTPSSAQITPRTTRSNTRVTRSSTRVTRSSTVRTARTDCTDEIASPVSTVSGQILNVLTGRLATPLLRSMTTLRRVGSGYLGGEEEGGSGSSSPPVRRLPALPSSPEIPPVPLIPRHHTTADIRPLPVPLSCVSPPVPTGIPRSASTGARPKTAVLERSLSMGVVRPLPVPPVLNP